MSPSRGAVQITRFLKEGIWKEALSHGKVAFVSGPPEVGKTTLGRHLLASPQNEKG